MGFASNGSLDAPLFQRGQFRIVRIEFRSGFGKPRRIGVEVEHGQTPRRPSFPAPAGNTSGFRYINTGSVAFGPRSGQIVGQFRW